MSAYKYFFNFKVFTVEQKYDVWNYFFIGNKNGKNKMVKFAHFIALLLVIIKESCMSEKCPVYCKCTLVSQLRHAECVSQRLVNIDLNLPKSVQSIDISNNSISSLDDRGFQVSWKYIF